MRGRCGLYTVGDTQVSAAMLDRSQFLPLHTPPKLTFWLYAELTMTLFLGVCAHVKHVCVYVCDSRTKRPGSSKALRALVLVSCHKLDRTLNSFPLLELNRENCKEGKVKRKGVIFLLTSALGLGLIVEIRSKKTGDKVKKLLCL